MTRTHRVQDNLHADMAFLDHLGDVGTSLDALLATHRSDLTAGKSEWPTELKELRSAVDSISDTPRDGVEMAALQHALSTDLVDLDSLHWEVVRTDQGPEEARMDEAVLALVGQRARGHLETMVREVRQGRIGTETLQLSEHWQEAQWLLLLAILFAVVSATLVGFNSRLLLKSHVRTEQLARASTELERINRELRETMLSKEEKEVMLKEIHHRVKNNLQIVRSLIRFQTDKVDDPRVQELFNECVNRVGAMALVHEQTYLSKDLANIDVGNYLNSLVRDLASAYNIRVKLHMDVNIQVRTLGVDTLTPLGLLINEVISNSFKHAFTGRESGTIIVHLSGSEEHGLDLRVGDDGVGIPDHGRWEKPKSLGMELIQTLAGQLNASIELQPGAGMVYALRSVPYPVRKSA